MAFPVRAGICLRFLWQHLYLLKLEFLSGIWRLWWKLFEAKFIQLDHFAPEKLLGNKFRRKFGKPCFLTYFFFALLILFSIAPPSFGSDIDIIRWCNLMRNRCKGLQENLILSQRNVFRQILLHNKGTKIYWLSPSERKKIANMVAFIYN